MYSYVRGRRVHLQLLVLVIAAMFSPIVHAASSVETVRCGQLLTREFDEARQIHDYHISMDPGSIINLRVIPMGVTLGVRVSIYEPANEEIMDSDYQREVRLTTGKLSGRGVHTIRISNSQYRSGGGESRIGVYTAEVSCVLSDGTKVAAGSHDNAPSAGASQAAPAYTTTNEELGEFADDVREVEATTRAAEQAANAVIKVVDIAKGIGSIFRAKKPAQDSKPAPPAYPKPEAPKGQQPVYAQPIEAVAPAVSTGKNSPSIVRASFPLLGLGTILQNEITASTGAQGYRFKAQAGQKIDVAVERLLGNQGLVVTVFAPDQQPVFQASVLANPRIATTLQVPVAGEYAVEISAFGSSGVKTTPFKLHLASASK